ncbi:pyridoxamine 5'-phosphate oxidase family protein [Tenggerimyces flavus]|uniref:Pyridoxamine 5'-phosphate oxidase family protein n=1 Tax=Tenggerimyces flavus TaxID=1708749 RepID=A0ABV7YM48_9ACTN|nr:pyridoxamine 5'-phosphate oxidase family protein [Tenggerimyces flavus]MBM7787363.1 general stress protein 26 [Tenggerimyces flavus]
MADPLVELQNRTFEHATAATNKSYPPERRLTAEQLTAYLGRREYAVVGTARPDGRPHASMSLYLRSGTTFWLPTVSGSIRVRNLGEQPWLTLVIAENDDDTHIAVITEGPATVVGRDDLPDEVRTLVDEAFAYVWKWVDVWIRLDAERVLSYAAEAAHP